MQALSVQHVRSEKYLSTWISQRGAYICAVQLDAVPSVVLIAGMAPEALHLCLVDGRGVVHLHLSHESHGPDKYSRLRCNAGQAHAQDRSHDCMLRVLCSICCKEVPALCSQVRSTCLNNAGEPCLQALQPQCNPMKMVDL